MAADETIEVTNHGTVAAVLVPPSLSAFERLVAAGKVRLPSEGPVDLRHVTRVRSRQTSAQIVADTRGKW